LEPFFLPILTFSLALHLNKNKVYGKVLFLLILCFTGLTSFAQKDDTVRLYNGDRITGEFKRLEYGMLNFKTNDMGTLNIEWKCPINPDKKIL